MLYNYKLVKAMQTMNIENTEIISRKIMDSAFI